MKYTKTFLILTALFGGLQSSLTYADNPTSSKEQKMTWKANKNNALFILLVVVLGARSLYGTHSGRD